MTHLQEVQSAVLARPLWRLVGHDSVLGELAPLRSGSPCPSGQIPATPPTVRRPPPVPVPAGSTWQAIHHLHIVTAIHIRQVLLILITLFRVNYVQRLY